jgi:hypothetical protein
MNTHWAAWAGLFAVGFWGYGNWVEVRRLGREVAELKVQSKEQSLAAEAGAPANPDGAGMSGSDLMAVRGEIASLRRLIEERLKGGAAGMVPSVPSENPGSSSGPTARLPAFVRSGWVDRAGIPEAVLTGFRQQLGDVSIEGAHVKQGEGQVFYSLESKMADGRAVELALNQGGEVVRRNLEMELGGLPEGMQQRVHQTVGEVPVRRVAEVFEDGQTVYRVNAKAPNQAVEMVFSPDGRLLRTETMFREKRP